MITHNVLPELGVTLIPLTVDTAPPLTAGLVGEVLRACDAAEDAATDALVVIHLRPGAEETGAESWPGDVDVALVNKWEKALRRLERLDALTIAVAGGRSGGPTLEVLLTADHRIGEPDLVIRPPALAGSPWPGMAFHRLANQLGVARARRLALFGPDIAAEEALALSIIDEVTENPEGAVADTGARLAGLPVSELAVCRRLLLDATTTSFEESLGRHLAACDRTLRHRRDVPA